MTDYVCTLRLQVAAADDKESDDESDGNLTWQSAALCLSTSTACTSGAVCISDPQVMASGSKVDLSAVGTLDWIHWGIPKAVGPFFTETKAGGPGALEASLLSV